MTLPGRTGSSTAYRYGFQGQEKDDELKGEGNSYTTEFRQYDPRFGRWLSLDLLEKKFPWMSPYNYAANNPILYIDPNGKEPIKGKVVGLLAYIKMLSNQSVMSLSGLRTLYSNNVSSAAYGKSSDSDQIENKRYLYSDRWGWLDMKHFSAAADYTDYYLISAKRVLEKGEEVEREQFQNGSGSAYSYEDFPSNLLGVYFEEWLENDNTTFGETINMRKELGIEKLEMFQLKVYKYLKELGFVDNPKNFKDYNKLATGESDSTQMRGLKNNTYGPHPETIEKPLNTEIDSDVIKYYKLIRGIKETQDETEIH